MSSQEKSLLESLTPSSTNELLLSMTLGTQHAYLEFERWSIARSSDPGAQALIKRMSDEGQQFHQAMVASKAVASRGADMADDAVFMCKRALAEEGSKLTLRSQKALFKKLLARAKEGLELSRAVEHSLQLVSNNLVEIHQSVPQTVSDIKKKQEEEIAKKQSAGDAADVMDVVTALSLGATLVFPPAIMLALITDSVSSECRSVQEECVGALTGMSDALDNLRDLSSGVESTLVSVRALQSFWEEDVRKLTKLEKDSDPLALSDAEEILVEQLQDGWGTVGARYKEYNSTVRVLGDIYSVRRRMISPV